MSVEWFAGDASVFDPHSIAAAMGKSWRIAQEGGDGWKFIRGSGGRVDGTLIVSAMYRDSPLGVPEHWIHASLSMVSRDPTYLDVARMHRAVFGDRPSYQAFVPASEHYNLHAHCLHLWGRADGISMLPDFRGPGGTV